MLDIVCELFSRVNHICWMNACEALITRSIFTQNAKPVALGDDPLLLGVGCDQVVVPEVVKKVMADGENDPAEQARENYCWT